MITTTDTPYTEARRTADERSLVLIDRERRSRYAAIAFFVIAVVSLLCNVMQAKRTNFSTQVVMTDTTGNVLGSAIAAPTPINDERLIRAALNTWVMDWRTVSNDPEMNKRNYFWVFGHVGASSPANNILAAYYKGDQHPDTRAKLERVNVSMQSIIKSSEHTYTIRWTEISRDLSGDIRGARPWTGSFTLALNPPKDADSIVTINPLGIYLTNLSVSPVAE